eukprot:COSAG02_NODE_1442_length_12573_cov_2.397485_5_plen_64_part_00
MFPNQMQLYNCKRKIDSDSDNIPLHALEIQKGADMYSRNISCGRATLLHDKKICDFECDCPTN